MMHGRRQPSSTLSPSTALLLAAVGVGLAACGQTLVEPDRVPTGVVSIFVRSVAGQYVARPEALFVESTSPPTADSRSTDDLCQLGPFTTVRTLPSDLVFLDAGDSIAFDAEGERRYLRPVTNLGLTTYVLATADVSFTPGANVTFTIPGGSVGAFPTATISSATAPPLETLSPIPAEPSLDQPLAVSWTPVGDDSSRFEISLRFDSNGDAELDQKILCEWRDDGSHQIAAGLLASGWVTSDVKQVEVTRYRTSRQTLGNAVLLLLATFDSVPPVVFP